MFERERDKRFVKGSSYLNGRWQENVRGPIRIVQGHQSSITRMSRILRSTKMSMMSPLLNLLNLVT